MPKFRKKPVVDPVTFEAHQWGKNGDHPVDLYHADFEGALVRRYRIHSIDGQVECSHCKRKMERHGWIDTPEGGHIVCPDDWIIKGANNEFYPCKPDIFEKTYERADPERDA